MSQNDDLKDVRKRSGLSKNKFKSVNKMEIKDENLNVRITKSKKRKICQLVDLSQTGDIGIEAFETETVTSFVERAIDLYIFILEGGFIVD